MTIPYYRIMGGESQSKQVDLDSIQNLLVSLFSWLVLTAIGVIVSGKLMGIRIKLGFSAEDLFSINLLLFRIRAKGDEVTLGFGLFLLALGVVVIFGGQDAYLFFKSHAGIDIGHWSSLCAIASFFSIVAAALCWLLMPKLQKSPIVSSVEREQQIENLQKARETEP